jgi:hypothetical protein
MSANEPYLVWMANKRWQDHGFDQRITKEMERHARILWVDPPVSLATSAQHRFGGRRRLRRGYGRRAGLPGNGRQAVTGTGLGAGEDRHRPMRRTGAARRGGPPDHHPPGRRPAAAARGPSGAGGRQAIRQGAVRQGGRGFGVDPAGPLFAAIALAIKAADRGPVFFGQIRVGKDGRVFSVFKFRTMVVDAEQRKALLATHNEGAGVLFKIRHDPRVTRPGSWLRRWSLVAG